MRFTLRQLEIFAAVVRTGQVKRAAETLHLSQAAVSQALRELAVSLDVALFERHGRAILPTAAAHQLLALASPPMATLEHAARQIADTAAERALAGPIHMAASSTIARYLLPEPVTALLRVHPALELTLYSGNSATVERQLADHSVDVGFIEGPAQRDDLEATAWHTDTLEVIAPADYPVETIDPTALNAHRWVARESGSGTRAVFEQSLALAGFAAPRATLRLDDTGAIVRAVAAGAGLACVSRLAAAKAGPTTGIRPVTLPGLSLERPLWRLRRRDAVDPPIVARFNQLLDAELAGGDLPAAAL